MPGFCKAKYRPKIIVVQKKNIKRTLAGLPLIENKRLTKSKLWANNNILLRDTIKEQSETFFVIKR